MKLGKTIFVGTFFLLLLNSCNKEKEQVRTPVMAGVYSIDMLYHKYSPQLELQLKPDSLEDMKFGTDSVDIDLDGSSDIIINQRMILSGSDDINNSYLEEDNFPFIGLITKNDFEVAYEWIKVNVGQGYFNSISLVAPLPHDTRIDRIENWSDSNVRNYFGYENGQIWLWAAPPSIFWSYGNWYSLTDMEVYIGIRKKTDAEYKFGWIKFQVYSRDKFEIMSYAIEK